MRRSWLATWLLAAVLPAASCRQAYEAAALRQMLGDELDGAKVVAVREDSLVTIELASGRTRMLASYPKADRFEGLSRPYWSPDGHEILFARGGQAFLMNEDGSGQRRILSDQPRVYEPSWWVDPATGQRCIVFKTANGKHRYRRGKPSSGATYLCRLDPGATTLLADFPCDGGLSRDGTHLGEAYFGCLIVDVPGRRFHVLYDGKQSCNASMSPDDTYRIMHLYLPHSRFGVRNLFDRELWSIGAPPGSDEWETPRWSNHTNFCMATARFGKGYRLAVVRMDNKKTTVLNSLGDGWSVPQLWLPSAAPSPPDSPISGLPLTKLAAVKEDVARASTYTPIIARLAGSSEPEAAAVVKALEDHGRRILREALECDDAFRARGMLRELAAHFADHAIGRQAEAELTSGRFQRELTAASKLERLKELEGRLYAAANVRPRYDDAAFLDRNRAVLDGMAALAREIGEEFAETRAAGPAREIASRYGLPENTPAPADAKVRLVATIREVSKVPDPRDALYSEAVVYIRYRVEQVIDGQYRDDTMIVVHWGMREHRLLPPASWRPGRRQELLVDPFDTHPELESINAAQDADDPQFTPYWALDVRDADPGSPSREQAE